MINGPEGGSDSIKLWGELAAARRIASPCLRQFFSMLPEDLLATLRPIDFIARIDPHKLVNIPLMKAGMHKLDEPSAERTYMLKDGAEAATTGLGQYAQIMVDWIPTLFEKPHLVQELQASETAMLWSHLAVLSSN